MTLDWRFWCFWIALLGAPMAIFATLLILPEKDSFWRDLDFHFWVVSGTAIAAAIFCLLIIARARSLRETRTLFLGLAFMSIAGIFAVHGLGTPNHLHDEPHAELLISSWLSVLAGGAFIAASGASLPEHADDWFKQNGSLVFAAIALGLGLYIGLSVASPDWLSWVPVQNRGLQLGVTAVTLVLLSFGAWRYFQAFLFARMPSQWAMVVALALLIEVQVCLTWGRQWQLSWWEYHFLYGSAFLVLFAGWAIEAVRAGGLGVIADSLMMRDAIAQLNRGYARPISDLLDAIELKDLYTLGHVRRVAGFALLIGRELNLSSVEQRNLVLAGQMHDIGKLGTPDRILTKPSALTPTEFEIIKEHAERGYHTALKVKALQPVAEAIRDHHEKFDGSGYPCGLEGEDIPLLARIVAVADAYDAMTSGRVYQSAVSQEAALDELRRCSGRHFDPACVDAFVAALGKQSDVAQVEKTLATSRAQRELAA